MSATINVTGATGNGTTDDTAAFQTAFTSAAGQPGSTVVVPAPSTAYRLTSAITIPYGTRVVGANKYGTIILKDFAGSYLFEMEGGTSLENLWLKGLNKTGNLLNLTLGAAHGNQNVRDCKLTECLGHCIYFTANTGSRFNLDNVDAYSTGSGVAAIKIQDVTGQGGCPRSFMHLETAGQPSFDFGAANDLYISNSTLGEMTFSTNSVNVTIASSRIQGSSTLILKGSGSIVGCDIFPNVQIHANAVFSVGPGMFNNGVTETSVNGYTQVFSPNPIPGFALVLKAGTTPIPSALISGTPQIWSRRLGEFVIFGVAINFLAEAPPIVFPTGPITIDLPVPSARADLASQFLFQGRLIDKNGTPYGIGGFTALGDTVVHLTRDTTGLVTATSPGPLGNGATLQLTGFYAI